MCQGAVGETLKSGWASSGQTILSKTGLDGRGERPFPASQQLCDAYDFAGLARPRPMGRPGATLSNAAASSGK